jgi:hypothetical protein
VVQQVIVIIIIMEPRLDSPLGVWVPQLVHVHGVLVCFNFRLFLEAGSASAIKKKHWRICGKTRFFATVTVSVVERRRE